MRFYWIVSLLSPSQWVELISTHCRSEIFSREEGIYSRFHKAFAKIFQISFQSSQVRCEVQSSYWKSQTGFLNKAFDWIISIHGPNRGFVYKLAFKFQYELLNFATNLRTLERNLEYFGKSFVKSTVIMELFMFNHPYFSHKQFFANNINSVNFAAVESVPKTITSLNRVIIRVSN